MTSCYLIARTKTNLFTGERGKLSGPSDLRETTEERQKCTFFSVFFPDSVDPQN